MKPLYLVVLLILTTPHLAAAQNMQAYLTGFISFTDKTLIPFLLGIAFLIFVYNAIKYFVVEGASEDGREKAKALAIYSVAAFVLIIIFWGIVRMVATSTGLSGCQQPLTDYQKLKMSGTTGAPWSGDCP